MPRRMEVGQEGGRTERRQGRQTGQERGRTGHKKERGIDRKD